jgi:hypothetical protein
VFNDCEGLEDLKTHTKKFCFQDSNLLITHRGLEFKFT